MYNKCIRKIFAWSIILLLVFHVFVPVVALAQVAPTDTPAPTTDPNTITPTPTVDQTNVNNGASVTNGTNSSANTGSNTTAADTGTPTPTDTPTDTPTPTPDPNATLPTDTPTPAVDPTISIDPNATASADITASNDATVNNSASTTSNTGSNATTSNGNTNSSSGLESTPTPTPTPQVAIQTGNAVSVVAGDNTINTTSINSNVTDQTINIFGDQTGDIDLSTLFQLVGNIITNDNNNQPVINVQITGVNNYAYLANNVVSTANTGNNTTAGTGDIVVNTGNADSVVSLINKVNLTVVNSSLHIVTINIFGHLTGNVILPDMSPLTSNSCAMCGVTFNANNQATVNNSVNNTANTGDNTTTASGGATVTTGSAASGTNIVNVVNTNMLGSIFQYLFVNDFGLWNGSFLGWDGFGQQNAGSLSLSSAGSSGGTGPTNTISNIGINNTAYVNNNISSLSNTGGNTTVGQNTTLATGNAYSAVSLINLINSNFFRSLGFFGFLNIFGEWDGNIGGASQFVTPTPTPSQDAATTSDSTPIILGGGLLSVQNSNNVGAYVLPGDTVTFFVTAKNPGTGPVLGTKLNLYLIHNGQNVGGAQFNLGNINGGHGVKVTTGLVLSKNAEPGEYTARAVVTGTDGNGNQVSATADSVFTIFGNEITTNTTPITPVPPVIHKAILGASTNHNTKSDEPLYIALLSLLLGYLLIRILRARRELVEFFTVKADFKSKLNMLRLFLL